MTTKKPAPNAPEPEQAADREREDPMTSFEPEAGAAPQDPGVAAGEPHSGAPPAEPHRQGNGSEQTLRRPGAPGETPKSTPGAGQPSSAPGATQDAAEAGDAQGEAPQGAEAEEPDELELARQQAAAAEDRMLRLQAEFENYKRRIQKEHSDALRFALTPLVTEVAAIMDNLERAVEHVRKEPGDGVAPLLEGVEMVVRQMREALGRFGVKRIEAVGKPFDPSLHEAINVVETQDVPENQVLEEYQAGYLLHDRVVRPARVCVSKRAAEQPAESPPAETGP